MALIFSTVAAQERAVTIHSDRGSYGMDAKDEIRRLAKIESDCINAQLEDIQMFCRRRICVPVGTQSQDIVD